MSDSDIVKNQDPAAQGHNVVLIGFMGCGKSAVGPLAARYLGFDFVDTDDLIVEHAGMSIPDIFEAEGETGFRDRESQALEEAASQEGQVIATGGGIVTVERNLPLLMKAGFVVWLDASEETLWQRISRNSERPMLYTENPRETVNTLLNKRKPLYEKASNLRIDSTELSADEVAYGVAESTRVFFGTQRAET